MAAKHSASVTGNLGVEKATIDSVVSRTIQKTVLSSRADWTRAMVYESIDHGNDVTCPV